MTSFFPQKMVPECKPEWSREAITVFSRLPSLRRLQATPLLQTSLNIAQSFDEYHNLSNFSPIFCPKYEKLSCKVSLKSKQTRKFFLLNIGLKLISCRVCQIIEIQYNDSNKHFNQFSDYIHGKNPFSSYKYIQIHTYKQKLIPLQ